ncbi:MCE family protein [Actinocorallia sp. API 0066]|uniref:MlaD family protein n=1 Tax=Actinocorallia sp. API 0066 TaxID=2896846 RepID=UPI001E42A9BE|nr:MlaD family protein [Actinocorallia sp. API 0066]MCD0449362.1 MCE family protein [Actinocorallia sp. API 0066]
MKSFRDRDPIIVGLVSATGLALLVGGVYLVGSTGVLKDRYTMSGVFTGTGDLRSGDEVRVAGVRVGEVSSVAPDFRRGRVVITWKVDSDVDLGPATRAEIRTANVLGGRYLRLTGPVARPYLHTLPEDKRRIPEERTRTPATVNSVVSDSARTVEKLDAKALNRLVAQLTGVSEETRGKLRGSLRNLAALAETVSESSEDINKLLNGGDKLMAVMHTRDGQLTKLLANVRLMLAEVQARRDELATFLGDSSTVVQELTDLIDDHQRQLTGVIADLRGTLATLRPQLGDLGTVLAWAGPTLTGLAGAGGYGPWVEVAATGLGPLTPADLGALVDSAKDGGS